MKISHLSRWAKDLASLFGIYAGLFLAVFFSGELSDGVRNGLSVSFNLLIPSMFLFMILSNLLMATSAARLLARPFLFLFRILFRIGGRESAIVILSLLGGYPVGAKLLADAVRKGEMTPQTAERMLAFCVNCGPAFLVTGVGVNLFGSLQLGLVLYTSQIAACLTVGFLSSRGRRCRLEAQHSKSRRSAVSVPTRGLSTIFVGAVNDAARNMAVICAFVVAFSAILPIVSLVSSRFSENASLLVRGLLEVTTGCQSLPEAEDVDRILLAALFTAFGGACVILQVCAMLHGSGISMKRFFLWRIPYAIVSVAVTRLLLSCLPGVVDTMALNGSFRRQAWSVSPAAALSLTLLCVMLLFFSGKSARMKSKEFS